MVNVQTLTLGPTKLVLIRHRGDYEQIGAKFDALWQWIEANDIPALRTIGIYYDNPDHTPTAQLRSAACAEIPYNYQVSLSGSPGVEIDELRPGQYAVARHVGPYEQLGRAWQMLIEEIEGRMNRQISENDPAFEVYVNDPSDTEPVSLITELYMPLV